MSSVAVRAERLAKSYRLGTRASRYGTLRDALASAARAPVRAFRGGSSRPNRLFWALQDVSFEVQRGEVLGIIGRNGAGKSTLLKLLSRVTRPTAGRAEISGRVGSLLEVGTGFHPELSGRENIFLNGAILGMTRADINRNFDAIVEFAEVEQFLDTPVKRYSTGMHMRLAFSVAAHLEPEILIVDEVLAVGDSAFQKKCLGRMDHVAREGRTVLFVSHSMPTVMSLCQTTLLLKSGKLVDQGPPAIVVPRYLASLAASGEVTLEHRTDRLGDGSARLLSIEVRSTDPDGIIRTDSRLQLRVGYTSERPVRHGQFVISIVDQMDIGIFVLQNEMGGGLPEVLPSRGVVTCVTDPINLTPGRCVVHLEILKGNVRADYVPHAGSFDVEADDSSGGVLRRDWALCVLRHTWSVDDC